MKPRSQRGFTLMEVMISVVVVAILTAVALPSYRQHIANSRRAEGKAATMVLAQLMERWYTENMTYAFVKPSAWNGLTRSTSATNASVKVNSENGFYELSITAQDANGFTISATPRGAQAGDACGSYTYDQTGAKGVSGGSRSVAQCW